MTIGNQLAQPDPRGWLVFDDLDTTTQHAEDSTAGADYERAHRFNAFEPIGDVTAPWGRYVYPPDPARVDWRPRGVWFTRHATATERELLQHLGFSLPDELFTLVTFDTAIRNRRWPQLEETRQ